MSEYNRNHNQSKTRKRTGPAIAALAAVVVAGGIVKNNYDHQGRVAANEAQPACFFPGVEAPQGIDSLTNEIAAKDDSVRDDKVTVRNMLGEEVTRRNRYQVTREGSMVIRYDDTIEYEHVDPQVCVDLGGSTSPEEIANRDTNQ